MNDEMMQTTLTWKNFGSGNLKEMVMNELWKYESVKFHDVHHGITDSNNTSVDQLFWNN